MTVILSIKPYYLYLILIGEKTIELRKSFPEREEWDKTAFLYCTKDMRSFALIPEKDQGWMRDKLGKIACKIVVDKFYTFIPTQNGFKTKNISSARALHKSRLRIFEVKNYLKENTGYGWHIASLVLFEPRDLSKFRKMGFMTEEQWLYNLYPNTHCHYDAWAKKFEIERPPQSWCYALEVS